MAWFNHWLTSTDEGLKHTTQDVSVAKAAATKVTLDHSQQNQAEGAQMKTLTHRKHTTTLTVPTAACRRQLY